MPATAWIKSLKERGTTSLLEEFPRWRLWIPVALGIGIALYFALPQEPSLEVSWGLLGLLTVLFLTKRRHFREQHPLYYFFLIGIMWGFCGFSLAAARTAWLQTTLLYRSFPHLAFEGEVRLAETTPQGLRLTLAPIHFLTSRALPPLQKVILTGKGPKMFPFLAGIKPGTLVRGCATLLPIQPPLTPASFDFRRHAFFQGLSARGFLTEPPVVRKEAPATTRLSHIFSWGEAARFVVRQRITSFLPPCEAAIASALIIGEKSAIPPAVRQAFSDSGTAHILAISGLHMTLVGGVFFLLFRSLFCCIPFFAFRPQAKKGAAIASWLGTLGYLGLSGASTSSLRAFLMHTLIMLAVLWDRVAFSMSSVALAATLILLFTPEVLITPSFQMSFSAVIALIAVYERGNPTVVFARKGLRYLGGLCLTSLIASLATTPFSAYTFRQGSLMGIPANILAVPLTGFWIMPCAVGALIFLPLGGEGPFLRLMGWGLKGLERITEIVAHWPGAHLVIPPPTTFVLSLGVLGALWMVLWRRRWRFWGLLPMGSALAFYILTPCPDFMIDLAATCVGVRTAQGAFVTARNHARSAQKVWGQEWGYTAPLPKKGALTSGLWSIKNPGQPTLLITEEAYTGPSPSRSGECHIDLSGRFPEATLTRTQIMAGLGGYGYFRKGKMLFFSVREAVGERPWSFRGSLARPPSRSSPKHSTIRPKIEEKKCAS
jgi:competence protein ComEC